MDIQATILSGKSVLLRPVNRLVDTTSNYLRWMNEYEVVKYLESRFKIWSSHDLVKYVDETQAKGDFLRAITFEGNHVGNIRLTIHWIHGFAEVGLVIDKPYWNRGVGTEAISLISDYAFQKLKLHKLWAGCYSDNKGAIKAFQKAGFEIEGILKKQYLFEGRWVDDVLLSRFNDIFNDIL